VRRRLVETADSGGAIDKEDRMSNAQHGMSPWTRLEADRAFTAASRARLRAALLGRFRQARRPKLVTRGRWQRVWLAVQQGATLPPISVVQIGDGYAIRDAHHRVSVAKARGALTIPALVG
jgi:hypothetical protein